MGNFEKALLGCLPHPTKIKKKKKFCEGHPHTPGEGAVPLCTPSRSEN
jgi:hypothetical protein